MAEVGASCGCAHSLAGEGKFGEGDTVREVLARVAEILRSEPAVFGESFPNSNMEPVHQARWLLSAVLSVSMSDLSMRMLQGCKVDYRGLRAVDDALMRLRSGEPFAYAVGTAEFRHLTLHVDRRVLIPRPETEIVVEVALRVTRERAGGVALDIGTGSGAIALSLATEGRFDHVIATDISLDALEVARGNARRVLERAVKPVGSNPASVSGYNSCATVEFRAGVDLEPLAGVRARVLVSNPPYIAYEEAAALPASVRDWEPSVALFAEREGMARYDAILSGASAVLEPGGYVVLELDSRRAQQTADMAAKAGFADIEIIPDLSGRDRVLVARG